MADVFLLLRKMKQLRVLKSKIQMLIMKMQENRFPILMQLLRLKSCMMIWLATVMISSNNLNFYRENYSWMMFSEVTNHANSTQLLLFLHRLLQSKAERLTLWEGEETTENAKNKDDHHPRGLSTFPQLSS
ncbi:uncharacterized protein LOC124275407 [Haliotis rubra]|uniref:uncharacterized protein LOC124275407 n=1 Tax=Haliotis rubra TaxID=36100 RepID=UPI001EE5FB61|nr:uncharacterized protein LOC124275407 [Haliotis rubra]